MGRRDNDHHHVYVVELDPKVATIGRFRAANPRYVDGRMCFYVGMTGLTPEERFRNHKRGHKDNRYVREYGIRLLPELYEKLNPMPYSEAAEKEAELARRLRAKGYGVWQN